jgi:arylsulfatase A-like enzyme
LIKKAMAPFSCCFLLATYLLMAPAFAQPPKRPVATPPNIIYILADDLGYGDLGCYGQRIVKTPNLDRMAREGTRFTRFYAGSTVCAPSRAALMTGQHSGRGYVRGNGEIPFRAQDTTLAQRLKAIGYRTGMFGKWGLGTENTDGTPDKKGFDEFLGYLHHRHAHNYHTDHLWQVRAGQLSKLPTDTAAYTHDLIMGRAFDFVKTSRNRPFFLYLPITLVHAELATTPQDLKPFVDANGQSKLQPEKSYVRRGAMTYQTQPQGHATFAAMLSRLDADVGRLLKLLRDLGLDKNTLVLFTSDNGPHQEGGADPEFFDSNGPLRGIKRDLYEGGIRVPMIARWPGNVPAGNVSNTVWANWDVLPTFAALTGYATPTGIDGVSMLPTLRGKAQPTPHPYLYWQFNEGVLKEAVLQENWKLVRLKEKGKPEVLELYDLSTDETETRNLADSQPARLAQLRQLMRASTTPPQHPKFDYAAFNQANE